MIAGALRIKTEERQELLEELDVAKRLRRLSELLARELELISIGTQDPVAGRVRDGQGPARVLPAPAAQGDPGGAGRGGRAGGRGQRAARADRGRRTCPSTRSSRPSASCSASSACRPQAAEHGVIRSYLEWLADAAVVEVHRGPPRPEGGAPRCSTRDHYDIEKVKDRILEFLAVRKLKPDARSSILCFVGPARRGQDLAGQVDRRGDGPRVRAHLGRRRARRVGDPRPPPHLHRRHARDDHPRDARRRVQQPGADDRRDRQDGRGLPRRPLQRDARGARPRAELQPSATTTSTCRSTCRRCLFITTANQLDPIPRAAARPDGGDRAARATPRRRSSRSPSATWCRGRWSGTAW